MIENILYFGFPVLTALIIQVYWEFRLYLEWKKSPIRGYTAEKWISEYLTPPPLEESEEYKKYLSAITRASLLDLEDLWKEEYMCLPLPQKPPEEIIAISTNWEFPKRNVLWPMP